MPFKFNNRVSLPTQRLQYKFLYSVITFRCGVARTKKISDGIARGPRNVSY